MSIDKNRTFDVEISKQAKKIMRYPSPTTWIGGSCILRCALFCENVANKACAGLER